MKYSIPAGFAELSEAVKDWQALVNQIAAEADNQDGATALTARYAGNLASALRQDHADAAEQLEMLKASRKK